MSENKEELEGISENQENTETSNENGRDQRRINIELNVTMRA